MSLEHQELEYVALHRRLRGARLPSRVASDLVIVVHRVLAVHQASEAVVDGERLPRMNSHRHLQKETMQIL